MIKLFQCVHRLPGEGGWIGLGDGFAPPRLYTFLFVFLNIMIYLCHVGFLCCKLYEHYSPIIKTAF